VVPALDLGIDIARWPQGIPQALRPAAFANLQEYDVEGLCSGGNASTDPAFV